MGLAVGSFERAGDHQMALTTIAVNNFIQRGNRTFFPIPKG
jgi:hypothetical protein